MDQSLTSTGLARVDTDSGRTITRAIKTGTMRGHERLQYILDELAALCQDADLVVLEGLSFGSSSSSKDLIAGNFYLIRHMLWRKRIPYALVPPWTLKQYITLSGKADKDGMVREIQATFPDVDVPNDDVADGVGLVTMGLRWKGAIVDAHRSRDLSQMAKCQWPDHTGQPMAVPKSHPPKFA